MLKRTIEIAGYPVEVYNFGYASFMYPEFNGNAEFPTTSKGFRQLSHYLRTCTWIRENLM